MVPQEEKVFYTVKDGRSPRARVAEWLAIRSAEPGITNGQAAQKMGLAKSTLQNLIVVAQKEGWLKFVDPLDQLEYDIIPKVVRNLNNLLDEGDRQVTIETAKGTLFPQFREAKGANEAKTTILALKVEYPETTPDMKIISGHVVGRPKLLKPIEPTDA